MRYKVKLQQNLYEELKEYLLRFSPEENGCFILGNVEKNIIFITEIVYPEREGDLLRDIDVCSPSSDYIMSAFIEAKEKQKTLVFIHSHPQEHHPSDFSELDLSSNTRLFENLSEILPYPIGSMVMSRENLHGVLYIKGVNQEISSFTVVGKSIQIFQGENHGSIDLDLQLFDRQLGFLSEKDMKTIQNLNIAIIGLGGVGSPLAVMLAKMGVGRLTFFDPDKLEKHNLPRIYGATNKDVGKYKVDVVKTFIQSFAHSEVYAHRKKIIDHSECLHEFDLIFGCIDNQSARAILNDTAIRYAIPYIDSGCAIPLDDDGIVQAVTSVSSILPGEACLWCAEILNGITIREESSSAEEKAQLKKDGYYSRIERAPSVISLTTFVASAAASRLFNVLGIYSDKIPMRTVFDLYSGLHYDYDYKPKESCYCSKNRPF